MHNTTDISYIMGDWIFLKPRTRARASELSGTAGGRALFRSLAKALGAKLLNTFGEMAV